MKYNRDDCTYYDCRRDKRLLNSKDRFDIQLLIVNDVESFVETTKECAAFDNNKEDDLTACYVIDTMVTVTRYPVKFGGKRTSLIIKAAVMDYVEYSDDFQIVHVESEPEKLKLILQCNLLNQWTNMNGSDSCRHMPMVCLMQHL